MSPEVSGDLFIWKFSGFFYMIINGEREKMGFIDAG